MTSINLYRVTPRKARNFIVRCLFAGLVPILTSSPGMGKSSIIDSISNEYNLQLIDHRMSTSVPEDMTGLPRFDENGFATFAPFIDIFPLEGHSEPPPGKDGWILFLDEFTAASKEVQKAAYKLILDRKVGQYKLDPRVMIVCAGNLKADRALTNDLGTAMQSRLVHIEMEINFQEWYEDVAMPQKYDFRVSSYLMWKQSHLMVFRPDHQDKTFCCPRTWEFVNRLVTDQEIDDDITPLLAGTITAEIAASFVSYVKLFSNLITIDQILKDPNNCKVLANDTGLMWAVVSSMIEAADNKNFAALSTYANRLDMSMRILYYRGCVTRTPILAEHPAFMTGMVALNQYMHPR